MARQLRMFGLSAQDPRDVPHRGNSLEDMNIEGVASDVFPGKLQRGSNGGAANMLCPSHDETTPSFYLRPKINAYHCYGCGISGGPLQLVMDFMSLPEQYLAMHFDYDPNSQQDRVRLANLLRLERERLGF